MLIGMGKIMNITKSLFGVHIYLFHYSLSSNTDKTTTRDKEIVSTVNWPGLDTLLVNLVNNKQTKKGFICQQINTQTQIY
jgi:hypothetical protein